MKKPPCEYRKMGVEAQTIVILLNTEAMLPSQGWVSKTADGFSKKLIRRTTEKKIQISQSDTNIESNNLEMLGSEGCSNNTWEMMKSKLHSGGLERWLSR